MKNVRIFFKIKQILMKNKVTLAMRLLFFLMCLFIGTTVFSQESKKYWFRIEDSSYIPEVIKLQNDIKLEFKDNRLNEIFSNYRVLNFKRYFPNSKKPFLQKVYEIEVVDENLIKEMKEKTPNIFINLEEVPEIQLLYIPNDYGTNGGALMDQEDLDFIYAPDAWDISQGNENVVIAIAESIKLDQEDLLGKSEMLSGSGASTFGHGTGVAVVAGANTDNNIGIASIGFDCYIKAKSGGVDAVVDLAQAGVKVINMSWGSCNLSQNTIDTYQEAMDEAHEEGAVLVAAAGNGSYSCPSLGASGKHYPAANRNVIAVTDIGFRYEIGDPDPDHDNQKDRFEHLNNTYITLTYNDSVDIAAPARHILTQKSGGSEVNGEYEYWGGTSVGAPIVTGTIGLMFSENYCLQPNEIETILKLTSRKIDNLTVNLAYYGQIGSGSLNSYEAVKMAKDMKDEFGTVEVKDRILYRPWFYKLETAPYEIKMSNNTITGDSKIKFRARNNIEILSGEYSPDSGYIDLEIDSDLTSCEVPTLSFLKKSLPKDVEDASKLGYVVYPTKVANEINVVNIVSEEAIISTIKIFDIFNQKVLEMSNIDTPKILVNLDYLTQGFYILKGYDQFEEDILTTKFIKE